MWAAYVAYDGARDGCIGQLFSKKTIPDDFGGLVPTAPVFVLPADPESVEGYGEAMANALCCEHMGALPGAYSLTPEKDCAKGSESAYMWRSARSALAALMKGRTGAPRR